MIEALLIEMYRRPGRAIFLITTGLTLAYVLLVRRRVDFLTLGYFGTLVYFSPGFFGFTYYLVGSRPTPVVLSEQAYNVMSVIIATLTGGMMLVKPTTGFIEHSPAILKQYWIAQAVAVVSLAMLHRERGDLLFAANKEFLLGDYGSRWLTCFELGALAAVIIAICVRSRFHIGLALIGVSVHLYLGFRTLAAFGLIAYIYIYLADKGRIRLFTQWRLISGAAFAGASLLLYKEMFVALRSANQNTLQQLIQDPETYYSAFMHSEPFGIANVLNLATQTASSLDFSYLWRLPLLIIPYLPEMGLDTSVSFNSQLQSIVLPGLAYGLAGNPWAEMYLFGGLGCTIVGALCFVGVLRWMSSVADRHRSPAMRVIAISLGSIWCFYFHRNEIAFQLNMTRNIALAFFGIWLVARYVPLLRVAQDRPNAHVSKIGRSTHRLIKHNATSCPVVLEHRVYKH